MSVRRYQACLNRYQEMLMPARVEDYVSQTNAVRAIDVYIETLDMEELGFKHTTPAFSAGQPPFNPKALLKLYLYGYHQDIRSSRKLERETHRNIEVIWLVEGIKPSYKTIANFRSHNKLALKATNKDFVLLCKELSLLGGGEEGDIVGIDGSFFSGNVSKNAIYTEKQLATQLESLDKKIEAYQAALDAQDAVDDKASKDILIEDPELEIKLERLKEKQAKKKVLQQKLQQSESKQIATVDEDARLLIKRDKITAGYNVQIAVDAKHKLIIAEDVVQEGNDKKQLYAMLEKAKAILQSENLTGLADTGYFEGNQLKQCEKDKINVYVPIPQASKRIEKQGRFTREQFQYDKEQDRYICPQQALLNRCGDKTRVINNKNHMTYKSLISVCNNCIEQANCLGEKSKRKQLYRWEHEEIIERHAKRMLQSAGKMRIRSALVEHPFGILKQRAGIKHFLMRGLEKCRGEFSLMVLGFNFTRMLNLLKPEKFLKHCVQRQRNRTIVFE